MIESARPHIEEAYRLLTGECYRGPSPEEMQPVEGVCTIVMDLQRIDCAVGKPGESLFAAIADTIQAAYVEITAARNALKSPPASQLPE